MTRLAHKRRFPFVEPKSLRRAVVVCHRNADADTYLSAWALSKLLHSIASGCRVDIATPDGMTTLTSKLSTKFRHRTLTDVRGGYDLYVAVDVGDTELLKGWKKEMAESGVERVLVDHHPYRESETYDHVIVDETATSAAEMVYRLYLQCRTKIDAPTAQALLEGIMFDSSHLAIAGASALRAVVDLIGRGADIDEARRDLRTEPDQGEVMARLKGARRLRIYRAGSWIGASTLVGSFQAHVARSLLNLGADFAIVGGESDGETRVSMRGTQRFMEGSKVQLGRDVAEYVGARLGGHGGGHSTAASFSCRADEETAVLAALKRIGDLLESEPQEIGA